MGVQPLLPAEPLQVAVAEQQVQPAKVVKAEPAVTAAAAAAAVSSVVAVATTAAAAAVLALPMQPALQTRPIHKVSALETVKL